MFKSVKKAISGVFGARVVAKPRRNVIALPVDTAAESEEALVDARQGLIATLEAILQGKKDAESEAIEEFLNELHEGFCDGNYYDGTLCLYLEKLGVVEDWKSPNWGSYDQRWGALAAAIEYFAGCFPVGVADIEHALKVIASGNYRYIADGYSCSVVDDDSLGRFIARENIHCDEYGWGLVEAYFDFEACGRDYRESKHGKFTPYGFFAEF